MSAPHDAAKASAAPDTTAAPFIKLEPSPAESFLSMPGEYPSLFETAPGVGNPLEAVMTPRSMSEASVAATPAGAASSPTPEMLEDNDDGTDGAEGKKTAKKRKSWGQVLPEPKTNLPPR
jgi:transcriptional activator HAC1